MISLHTIRYISLPLQAIQGQTTSTTDNTGIDDSHYRQYRDRLLPLQTIQGYRTSNAENTGIDDFTTYTQIYLTSTTSNTGIDDFHYRQYKDRLLQLQTTQG